MTFELSICIPTYNRDKELKCALDSIICQIKDDIRNRFEICISDNASIDGTKELIENYRKIYPHITYFCWDKNMGYDSNLLKVVEIAIGKFCWIFSSDDIFLSNAIKTVLNKIEDNNCDILNVRAIEYDANLNYMREKHAKMQDDIIYRDCSKCIKEIGTNFSYISSDVFLKEKWDKENAERKFIGSSFIQTYVLFKMIKNNAIVRYIKEPLIGFRVGNDSFLSAMDNFNRLKIDVTGMNDIAMEVFGKYSKELKYINRITVRHHSFNHIKIALLNRAASLNYRYKAFLLLWQYYKTYIFFWIKVMLLLILPSFCLRVPRFLYRKLFKYRFVWKRVN
ncbi:MAG: glycosyltransferase [Elusimicrobiota bacterium]|jgi:abequosyltransferase|nr:glycosyltransferase [Elusimicrobiota bacterium]